MYFEHQLLKSVALVETCIEQWLKVAQLNFFTVNWVVHIHTYTDLNRRQ